MSEKPTDAASGPGGVAGWLLPGPMIAFGGAFLLVAVVGLYANHDGPRDAHPREWAELVGARELRFLDRSDGAVVILDHPEGDAVAVLDPGTNGFVRGVMRGMARERRSKGVGAEPPYRLARWSDGRVTLEDPRTGRWIELVAFGPDNFRAFAQLLGSDGS